MSLESKLTDVEKKEILEELIKTRLRLAFKDFYELAFLQWHTQEGYIPVEIEEGFLGTLAVLDKKKYIELINKINPNDLVKITKVLAALEKGPYEGDAIPYFKEVFSIDEHLMYSNFGEFIQLVRENIFSNEFSREGKLKGLLETTLLFGNMLKFPEEISEDKVYQTIKKITNSKYAQSKKEIMDQLTKVLEKSYPGSWLDGSEIYFFEELDHLLNEGLCETLDEVLECINLEESIIIADYHVLKKLKSGGWSNIYLVCETEETDEEFIRILKVPSQNLDNENVRKIIAKYGSVEKALEAIALEEGKINSKLCQTSRDKFKHFEYQPLPKYLTQIDCRLKNRLPGLVYEFIWGETFEEYFQKERTEKETLNALTKTAYALNYIHQKGFTHNDIKPDNLMVGENGRVYLLDLAFSRIDESGSSIQGVRAYTAPERIMGGAPSTTAADQYSFGIVAYEALVGKKPMEYPDTKEGKAEFALKIHRGELRPNFDLLRQKTRKEIADIIEKCLAFSPEKRFNSMQEVEDVFYRLHSEK